MTDEWLEKLEVGAVAALVWEYDLADYFTFARGFYGWRHVVSSDEPSTNMPGRIKNMVARGLQP